MKDVLAPAQQAGPDGKTQGPQRGMLAKFGALGEDGMAAVGEKTILYPKQQINLKSVSVIYFD